MIAVNGKHADHVTAATTTSSTLYLVWVCSTLYLFWYLSVHLFLCFHHQDFSCFLSSGIVLCLSFFYYIFVLEHFAFLSLCVNVSFNPFCYVFSSLSKSSLSSTSKRAELEIFFRHLQAPNVTHRLESVKITFSIKFRRNATSGQS